MPQPSSFDLLTRVFITQVLDHVPIPSVGSRIVRYYDLALLRYDLPPSIQPSSPPSHHTLLRQTDKPRAPVVSYNVATPTLPVGPSDIIYTTLFLRPQDPGVTIRSATVAVERRIELHHAPAAPTPLVTAGINHAMAASASPTTTFSPASPTPSHSDDDASTPTTAQFTSGSLSSPQPPYEPRLSPSQTTFDSIASNSSSVPLLSPSSSHSSSSPISMPRVPSPSRPPPSPSSLSASPRVPLPPFDPPLRTLTATLVSTEVNSFTCDSSGLWVKNFTIQWPEARGTSRWAIGETSHSEFATVRFFVRTRVVVSGPGGVDTLELEPKELTVVPTNEADRRAAMEKWAEQKELAQRSKSKSPWRRRGEDGTQADIPPGKSSAHGLPSPPQTPAQSSESGDHRKSSSGTGSKPRKKSRRPHTSAGPSDKSNLTFAAARRSEAETDDPSVSSHSQSSAHSSHSHSSSKGKHKESGLGESMLQAVDMVRRKSRAREGEGKREREIGDVGRESEPEGPKSAGLGLQLGLEVDDVRAWEEELARIEQQSRRSSAGMFALFGITRKRTGG